ncbi:MAG: TVP38/TMEM64 family protein [Thermodesulfobacteriota bacterium]
MATQGRLRPVLVYFILLLVVCLLFYYYKEIYHAFRDTIRFFSNKAQVSALVASFGGFAPLAFIGLQILQVLFAPIPGELTGFVGGYLFGATLGFVYSTIGLSIGSLLAFLISRRLGLPFVRRFIGEELMAKFDYLMEHQGAFFSFLFFLIPGLPKDYFCYLLGLSPMHVFTFFMVSSIGRIPGTLLLSLQGQAVRSEDYRIFFVILGVALFFILLTVLYREKIEAWLKRKK